MPVKKDVTDQ